MARRVLPLLVLLAASAGAPLRAGPDGSLAGRVEAVLAEPDQAAAAALLDALLETKPDPAEVLAILREPPAVLPARETVHLAHGGRRLALEVTVPEGLTRDDPRPPIVLDIAHGRMLPWLELGKTVRVAVPALRPPEFSDEGRDAFLAVLRHVAWRSHGDPDRIWLTGFSWAAHAAWDTALHRPGALAGIAAFGGGPRRVHFRLAPNLVGLDVRAFCGGLDDAELVWNLEEMRAISRREGFDYRYELDPEKGHEMPLAGWRDVEDAVAAPAAPWPETGRREGSVLADGPAVESPLFRIDEVDAKRVAVPARVPVPAHLDDDGKRRATVKAMEKAVAAVDWEWERADGRVAIVLRGRGVRAITLFARAPFVREGEPLVVRVGRKTVFEGPARADVRTLLEEARRTGERLRPSLRRIPVRF